MNARPRYRWVMLTLLWLIYVALGLGSGALPVLVTPVVNDLGLSNAQVGVLLGAWQLVFILTATSAGILIDRWGEKRSILLGTLLMTLSLGLRVIAPSFAAMLPAVALLGAGAPMISVGGPKVLALWFDRQERGTAVGLYMTGAYLGTWMGMALTNALVMPRLHDDWRAVFLVYSGIVLAVAVMWVLLARADVRRRRAQRGPGSSRRWPR